MNNEQLNNKAFLNLMESTSNRRLIQHLRLQLFNKIDWQPEELPKLKLENSNVEKETFEEIEITTEFIIEELEKQVYIYKTYFRPKPCSLDDREIFEEYLVNQELRSYLLKGEEAKFGWEIFYLEYLSKFYNDFERKNDDKIGYHQKLYEFIVLDMDYDGEYECYH